MQIATAAELQRSTNKAKSLLEIFKPLTPAEKRAAGIVTAYEHQQTKQTK